VIAGHSDGPDTRQTIRTVSLGTFWRAFRYPFILLSALLIPRLMGDAVYGRYAFFMSVYLVLDVVADVGVTQTCGRFVPGFRDRPREDAAHFLHGMLGYGLLISAAVGLLGGGGLWLARRALFPPAGWVVLGLLLVLAKTEGTLFAFLFGRNEVARYSAKEALRSAGTFGFVAALFVPFGFTGALWGLVASECLLLAAAAWWTRDVLACPVRPIPLAAFRGYLGFGLAFYAPALLFSLLQRAGNIVIQFLTGSPREVAYFDIGNQFLMLTSTFLGLIVATLLPSLATLHAREDHARIRRWQRTVMTYCGVLVWFAFAVLAALGRHVIPRLLGPEFAPVYPAARILAVAAVPLMIGYAGMNFALLEKEPRVYLAAVLAGCGVMLAASGVLVPRLHAVGAAWASVLGYAVFGAVFLARYRGPLAEVLAGFWKVLAVGAVPAAATLWPLPALPSVALLAGMSAVYLGALAAMRLVRGSDVAAIRAAFTR
jgi:O-antigen/teichoic acid export membrane protein